MLEEHPRGKADLENELKALQEIGGHPNVIELLGFYCCSQRSCPPARAGAPKHRWIHFFWPSTWRLLHCHVARRPAEALLVSHSIAHHTTTHDLAGFVRDLVEGVRFLDENDILHKDLTSSPLASKDGSQVWPSYKDREGSEAGPAESSLMTFMDRDYDCDQIDVVFV